MQEMLYFLLQSVRNLDEFNKLFHLLLKEQILQIQKQLKKKENMKLVSIQVLKSNRFWRQPMWVWWCESGDVMSG